MKAENARTISHRWHEMASTYALVTLVDSQAFYHHAFAPLTSDHVFGGFPLRTAGLGLVGLVVALLATKIHPAVA
jgi:hypothetical protein